MLEKKPQIKEPSSTPKQVYNPPPDEKTDTQLILQVKPILDKAEAIVNKTELSGIDKIKAINTELAESKYSNNRHSSLINPLSWILDKIPDLGRDWDALKLTLALPVRLAYRTVLNLRLQALKENFQAIIIQCKENKDFKPALKAIDNFCKSSGFAEDPRFDAITALYDLIKNEPELRSSLPETLTQFQFHPLVAKTIALFNPGALPEKEIDKQLLVEHVWLQQQLLAKPVWQLKADEKPDSKLTDSTKLLSDASNILKGCNRVLLGDKPEKPEPWTTYLCQEGSIWRAYWIENGSFSPHDLPLENKNKILELLGGKKRN